MKTEFDIIIAGGKTGGHLFPGIAIAQSLELKNPGIRILFVGTDAPFEVNTLERYGYQHKRIFSKPVKGGRLKDKVLAVALILVSLIQSLFILLKYRPSFVLGVGGFSSFALVLAAWLLRIPTAIQEQNTIPGMTNRLLSRFAGTIFTAFEDTRHLPSGKTLWVGNPIRQPGKPSIRENMSEDSPKKPLTLDINPEDFIVLVTGGSQGAASINQAVMDAVQSMIKAGDQKNPPMDGIFIIHQTGIHDEKRMQKTYENLRAPVHAQAFFHDLPAIQEMADLVIARAGAGTLSELCIKGLPAVLVPFPHAADDHQTFNAKTLVNNGGAILIKDHELSGPILEKALLTLKSDKAVREKMAAAMKAMAMPHAAETIAEQILKQQRQKRVT